MNGRFFMCWLWIPLLAATGCSTPEESETRPPGQNVLSEEVLQQALTGPVDFVTHVRPVLEAKCVTCHQQEALPGRMSLASHAEAQRSGTLRAFIVPGQPESSPLLTRLDSAHTRVQAMPPVGESLTASEVTLLKRWISQGASWPQGPKGTLKTSPVVLDR
ncbi:cytochrome c [Prosthecobacter fusiformis]|uniref:Cytochrome c n=1 Tax=Prosthecobacter fusiformis TaxID=48464 RepID=A0A4R7SRZ7_9BACT|nr:c-type cytochrome domain-containing protein [Prosthecobacter fusiformis]TDU80957.1 cytochrome c [Prosthecobacter fusiformis]